MKDNKIETELEKSSYSKKMKWCRKEHRYSYYAKHNRLDPITSIILLITNIEALGIFLWIINLGINDLFSYYNKELLVALVDSISIIIPIHFSDKVTDLNYKIDTNKSYKLIDFIIITMSLVIIFFMCIFININFKEVNDIIQFIKQFLTMMNSVNVKMMIKLLLEIGIVTFIVYNIILFRYKLIFNLKKYLNNIFNLKNHFQVISLIVILIIIISQFNNIVTEIYYKYKGYKVLIILILLFLMFVINVKSIDLQFNYKDINKVNINDGLYTIESLSMGYVIILFALPEIIEKYFNFYLFKFFIKLMFGLKVFNINRLYLNHSYLTKYINNNSSQIKYLMLHFHWVYSLKNTFYVSFIQSILIILVDILLFYLVYLFSKIFIYGCVRKNNKKNFCTNLRYYFNSISFKDIK